MNKNLKNFFIYILLVVFTGIAFSAEASITDGTIVSGNQYAILCENDNCTNTSQINFLTTNGGVVHVTDSVITGKVWSSKMGWINLNPTKAGVTNTIDGILGGYAWGENAGWINFAPTTGGVTINNLGQFKGWAWAQNAGWIKFDCSIVGACVQTDWLPQSARPTQKARPLPPPVIPPAPVIVPLPVPAPVVVVPPKNVPDLEPTDLPPSHQDVDIIPKQTPTTDSSGSSAPSGAGATGGYSGGSSQSQFNPQTGGAPSGSGTINPPSIPPSNGVATNPKSLDVKPRSTTFSRSATLVKDTIVEIPSTIMNFTYNSITSVIDFIFSIFR